MSVRSLTIQVSNVISIVCGPDLMINSVAGQRFQCIGSAWKPHFPSCVPKTCTLKRAVEFAQLWTNNEANHLINKSNHNRRSVSFSNAKYQSIQLEHDQLLQVRCDAGFQLRGANALRCFFGELSAVFVHQFAQQEDFYRHNNAVQPNDQLWPSCLPRNCSLPALPHGQYERPLVAKQAEESGQFELTHGERVSYQCTDDQKPISVECDHGILKPRKPACNHFVRNDKTNIRIKSTTTDEQFLKEKIKEDEWFSSLTSEDQIQLQQLQKTDAIRIHPTLNEKKVHHDDSQSLWNKIQNSNSRSAWCHSPHHVQQLVKTSFGLENVSAGSHLIGFVELPVTMTGTSERKKEDIFSSFPKSKPRN